MNCPKVIVLFGDGINCERETALSFNQAGCQSEIVHINDLLENPMKLDGFDIMAIPGGFSFGDELGSGKLMALKIKEGLGEHFEKFVNDKKPILGICNGFQVLVKMGLLNSGIEKKPVTLTHNKTGEFINTWVKLETNTDTVCKWIDSSNLKSFSLPIRHGEGNFTTRDEWKEDVMESLISKGNIVLTYKDDVNGAMGKIAGVCSDDGLIFGLMPHPEAAYFKTTSPNLEGDVGELGVGSLIFKTITNYVMEGRSYE